MGVRWGFTSVCVCVCVCMCVCVFLCVGGGMDKLVKPVVWWCVN